MTTQHAYTFKAPYKEFPDPAGEGVCWYAALQVQIALPKEGSPRTKRFEAIIDSGASRCVFHASIGSSLGLDINQGDAEETNGIAGPTAMYLHRINLYAPGGIIEGLLSGFTDKLPVAAILGMKGFFESFRICFDPMARICILERIYQA